MNRLCGGGKNWLTFFCHTQDPSGNLVDRWESTGNLGIVLQEFSLSQTPPLGQWAITATVNVGLKYRNVFTFYRPLKDCHLNQIRKASSKMFTSHPLLHRAWLMGERSLWGIMVMDRLFATLFFSHASISEGLHCWLVHVCMDCHKNIVQKFIFPNVSIFFLSRVTRRLTL